MRDPYDMSISGHRQVVWVCASSSARREKEKEREEQGQARTTGVLFVKGNGAPNVVDNEEPLSIADSWNHSHWPPWHVGFDPFVKKRLTAVTGSGATSASRSSGRLADRRQEKSLNPSRKRLLPEIALPPLTRVCESTSTSRRADMPMACG